MFGRYKVYNVRNEINCSFQVINDAAVAVVPK